jgi:chromosome segregation ATPase
MDRINALELRENELRGNVNTLQEEAGEILKRAEKVWDHISGLEEQKKGLQEEIGVLQNTKRTLTAAEVDALKGTKTLTGRLKGVTHKEFEALKRTASLVDKVVAQRDRALSMVKAADERVALAEQRVKEAKNESPSMMLRIKYRGLQAEFERMQKRLKTVLDMIPERLGAIKNAIRNILDDREPSQRNYEKNREYELER